MTLQSTFRCDLPCNDDYELIIIIRDGLGRVIPRSDCDVAAQVAQVALRAFEQIQEIKKEETAHPLKFRAIVPLTPLESGKEARLFVGDREITQEALSIARDLQKSLYWVIVPSRYTYTALPPLSGHRSRLHSQEEGSWDLT